MFRTPRTQQARHLLVEALLAVEEYNGSEAQEAEEKLQVALHAVAGINEQLSFELQERFGLFET